MSDYQNQYGTDFNLDDDGAPSEALAAYLSHFLEEPQVRKEAGFSGLVISEDNGTDELFQSITEKVLESLKESFTKKQRDLIADAITAVGKSW